MSNEWPETDGLNTSLIYDAAQKMHTNEDMRSRIATGIAPRGAPRPVLGKAWTVRLTKSEQASAENSQRFIAAYDSVPAGVVLVIQAIGDLRGAVIGDVLAHRLKRLGVLGIVVDGPVRDVEGILACDIGCWSGSVTMASCRTDSIAVETGVEIQIGGVSVRPGDLVAADMDGVIFNPSTEAITLLQEARGYYRAEQLSHEKIEAGARASASYQAKR
ncbi:MAG: RraA family protein [Xanthobacteraceae bacterium]|nr:RraA family protein [Xanthobacteraceae bacterium]